MKCELYVTGISLTINNKIRKHKTHMQTNNQKGNIFYKHTENLTNVTFMDAEMQLLNKGLKYNLHYKQRDWIRTLATEADAAISKLHERDQPKPMNCNQG
jgi:hypothetical protein